MRTATENAGLPWWAALFLFFYRKDCIIAKCKGIYLSKEINKYRQEAGRCGWNLCIYGI